MINIYLQREKIVIMEFMRYEMIIKEYNNFNY